VWLVTEPIPAWATELPSGLPPGRFITPDRSWRPDEWTGGRVMWLSDEPAEDAAHWWCVLQEQQEKTGLRPVIMGWPDTCLGPRALTDVDAIDVERWLADSWARFREEQVEYLEVDDSERHAGVPEGIEPPDFDPGPPYDTWPGLAPAAPDIPDPELAARYMVTKIYPDLSQGQDYIGLVPARRSADIPAVMGWLGATNHIDPGTLSAVLRTWEDRFGVRVIGMTGATLYVSVAAPPAALEQATHVALEHLLVCPDNIYQSSAEIFPRYVTRLPGIPFWPFWWD
jgi:hypothetical protein